MTQPHDYWQQYLDAHFPDVGGDQVSATSGSEKTASSQVTSTAPVEQMDYAEKVAHAAIVLAELLDPNLADDSDPKTAQPYSYASEELDQNGLIADLHAKLAAQRGGVAPDQSDTMGQPSAVDKKTENMLSNEGAQHMTQRDAKSKAAEEMARILGHGPNKEPGLQAVTGSSASQLNYKYAGLRNPILNRLGGGA